MGFEEGICHPCHAKDREYCGHTGLKDWRGRDLLRVSLAAKQDDCAGNKHDHLDNQVHRQRAQLAIIAWDEWAQEFERTERDHAGDSHEEDNHCSFCFRRKFFIHQRSGGLVNAFCKLRILHALLECRVLVQVLTAAQRPQRGKNDTGKRGGHSHHEDLRNGIGVIDSTGVFRDDGR